MTKSVTVAVDANGADLGPEEVARGAAKALRSGVRILLFGPLDRLGNQPPGIEVVDAPVSVAKAADPATAVRDQSDASIVQVCRAVARGEADAFVAGGSTGTALAAGLFEIKRARGIFRPALALLMPVPDDPYLLLDVGANVTVRPEHLVQFAHMGGAFMEAVRGVRKPRVGLLSNGEEATKGTEVLLEARAALEANPGNLDFIGYVEGFAVGGGQANVIVTDGFTGNVALKVAEGTSTALLQAVKAAAQSNSQSRLGGLLLRSALRSFVKHIDPEEQGGAVLLGLRKLGVVPHGSFGARGIERAIDVAVRGVRDDVVGRTEDCLRAAQALRAPAQASANIASLTNQNE